MRYIFSARVTQGPERDHIANVAALRSTSVSRTLTHAGSAGHTRRCPCRPRRRAIRRDCRLGCRYDTAADSGRASLAPVTACSMLGCAEKTPIRPAVSKTPRTPSRRATPCRSPPPSRVHFYTRTSTSRPQQSMNSRRARFMMIEGPNGATAAIRCDATTGASARSSSPHKASALR
jgi:hypothetical protein